MPQSYVTSPGGGANTSPLGPRPSLGLVFWQGHAHRGWATRWSDYPAKNSKAVVDCPPPTPWSPATRAPEAGNGLALISITIAFIMCWALYWMLGTKPGLMMESHLNSHNR